MRLKFLIFICTIILTLKSCLSEDNLDLENLDTLIESTFNTSTSTETSGNEEECECIPYYQCKTNKNFVEDGVDMIDIRVKPETCNNYLEVCCASAATIMDPVTPTSQQEAQITPTFSTCGQRNPQGVGSLRITGNVDGESQFGEFPWMIAVTSKQQVEGSNTYVDVYQCGGSLLSPNIVLTAAHCVTNKTDLSVRAGEWDTQTNNEPLPLQKSAVRRVVIHEHFRSASVHNNVALLVLDKVMELAPHIRPICLPEQGENMDGRECVASGWGKDVFGKEGRYQVILKKVEMRIVKRDKCLEALQKTRLGGRFDLHESFICAGGEKGRDTCQGDGGSPLMCPSSTDPQVYVQAGIVAWGVGCGSEIPAVYVNVAQFSNWINEKLNEYKTDPSVQ